jgi:hypothetical protein
MAAENRSFSKTELFEMQRGNAALLGRLAAVASRKPQLASARAPAAAHILAESSAQRNRRKAAAEIEKANLRLLSKLQRTKSTVSALQGALPPPPGGARLSMGASARRGGGAAGAGASLAARPGWCDPTSQQRVSDTDAWRRDAVPHARAGAGGAGASPGRFGSRDLRDVALYASSDKHTL